jgi:hypothetical protein
MFTLVNLLASLGLVVALVSVYDAFKKREFVKAVILIAAGVAISVVTIMKNGADAASANIQTKNIDSLRDKIDDLHSLNIGANAKLVSIDLYLEKLESMGIKRDSIKNTPIITKQFINYIGSVGTLNQD